MSRAVPRLRDRAPSLRGPAIALLVTAAGLILACSDGGGLPIRVGVKRAPDPEVLRATAEPSWESSPPSAEAYRMIFGDHLGRRWLVYRLDVGSPGPSLRARFVSCGLETLSDTVPLSRLDADKLSTMTRASGLWSGELVPGATGDGLAWSHVSIEGVQDGRSLYFEGTAALELKAFEPIRKEWLRILNPGVAGRVEELWRTGCDASGKAVGDQ